MCLFVVGVLGDGQVLPTNFNWLQLDCAHWISGRKSEPGNMNCVYLVAFVRLYLFIIVKHSLLATCCKESYFQLIAV